MDSSVPSESEGEDELGEREALLEKLVDAAHRTLKSNDELCHIISMLQTHADTDNASTLNSKLGNAIELKHAPQLRIDVPPNTLNPLKGFPVRPGADDKGRDYEVKLTALVALRCATLQDTEDLWLGSNMNQVGDFDDTVLCKQSRDGKHTVYLIQLKHQDKPKEITEHDFTYLPPDKKGRKKKSEDFSLAKYYKGYKEMKKMLDNPTEGEFEIFQIMRKADLKFLLFTNRYINKCALLDRVSDKELEFLDTSTGKNCVYKFNEKKLAGYDQEFLQQLLLFTNQIHVDVINNQIKKELKKLVSSNLDDDYYKRVVDKFVTFVKAWTKSVVTNDKDSSKFCHILTKCDIITKLTDILLEPFKINFTKESFRASENATWHEIVKNKSITIADHNHDVLKYLREYLGGEITRKYCKELKNNWSDCLSKTGKDLFFKNLPDLSTKLLTIREGEEEINMYHIYHCLWFNRKLPVLLQIESMQNYDTIIKILKLSFFELRCIILKHEEVKLKLKDKSSLAYFITLEDLNEEDRRKILNHPVQIQGRSFEKLMHFIEKPMYKFIKCKDVIYILSESLNIGIQYEPLTRYFIPRNLYKVLLKFQVLEMGSEIFLIQDETDTDELQQKLKFVHLTKCINVNIFINATLQQIKKLKSKQKSIHLLNFDGNSWLGWQETYGTTKSIQRYQLRFNDSYNSDDILRYDYSLNGLRLLSANPGMGKSTLMDFITEQTPANIWVLKIPLGNYNSYYEEVRKVNVTSASHLKYFNDMILKRYNCTNVDLARAVFQKMLNSKDVLVLLDGFDEISICYKDEVTAIVRSLHHDGFQMWLTTRPHMKVHLETEFGTIATGLKPFTRGDQENFLMKYFIVNLSVSGVHEEALVKEFVQKLLDAALTNLQDSDGGFTRNPLQTKLLSEVFIEDLKRSLEQGTSCIKQHFNLLYLYEEFIKNKTDMLCGKVGPYAKQVHEFITSHQKLFALRMCFDKRDLVQLNIDDHLEVYFENNKNAMEILQNEGVVVAEYNEDRQTYNARFVHYTFAEYMAAQWLFENFNNKKVKVRAVTKKLINYRFNTGFYRLDFMFRMFDSLLAKSFSLFAAIVNGQIDEAQSLVQSKSDLIDAVGEGDRTIMHMVAVSINRIEVTKMIELIPNNKIAGFLRNDTFGYNPLDYAVKNNSLIVANQICERAKSTPININLDDSLLGGFNECATKALKFIYVKLLQCIISYNLLGNLVNENMPLMKCLMKDNYVKNDFVHQTLNQFGPEATISEVLQKMNIKSSNGFYNDLRFAAAFGTEANVRQLLNDDSTALNNHPFCYTPLHCAVIHQKPNIAEILLDAGADINILGPIRGETPLCFASKAGHDDLVLKLISRGADINTQTLDGQTPLYLALYERRVSTAELLLSKGADVSVENILSFTHLHIAAANGLDVIVLQLLGRGIDINARTHRNETPLHCAVRSRRSSTAKLLISRGADVNLENNFRETCLQVAARIGLVDVLPDIINKTFDVNVQDRFGKTALFYALKAKHTAIAKLLLVKGKVLNIKDFKGNSCLHFAAAGGDNDIVLELLNNGLDVNEQNYTDETPLVAAVMNSNVHTVELLLSKGADIYIKDSEGNTILHTAARVACFDLLTKFAAVIDVSSKNQFNQTPLHFSVFKYNFGEEEDVENQIKTISFLLNQGVDINVQDDDGNTVFHWLFNFRKNLYQEIIHITDEPLVENFKRDVARLLLDKNVNVGLQNKAGKTALDLATEEECGEAISVIQTFLDAQKRNKNSN